MGFPSGASGKEPACQCRRCKRRGFNPWVGKIPWRREPTPIFLSGESMDRGAWRAMVHRVAKSQTLLKGLSTNAYQSPSGIQITWARNDLVGKGGKSMERIQANTDHILAWQLFARYIHTYFSSKRSSPHLCGKDTTLSPFYR